MIISPHYDFVFQEGKLKHPAAFAQHAVITFPNAIVEEVNKEIHREKSAGRHRLDSLYYASLVQKLLKSSNIYELMDYFRPELAGGVALGSYILIRRCLRMIAKEHPELRQAVDSLVSTRYAPNPNFYAVVLLDDIEELVIEARNAGFGETAEEHQLRVLEMVLYRQTDYEFWVIAGHDEAEMRLKCFDAIALTHNRQSIKTVAYAEAQRLRLLLAEQRQVENPDEHGTYLEPTSDDLNPFL